MYDAEHEGREDAIPDTLPRLRRLLDSAGQGLP